MKSSITYKLAVLIAVPVIYLMIVSGLMSPEVKSSPPSIQYVPKDFTNCIFNADYNEIQLSPQFYVENNVSNYWDELHFNAIQWYDFKGHTKYGIPGVMLDQNQIGDYKSVLDEVSTKPLKGFYEKCNFSYPMYGQRLVYEIHDGVPDYTDLNYGFVYQTVMQNVHTTDGGRTVLHPRPVIDDEGYLCRDIYENFQHTDLFDFRQNDQGTWYIKPVMKIPTGLADDLLVVTIEVVSFDNTVVKTIPIRTQDFKEGSSYGGEYRSNYPLISADLQISGSTGTYDLNKNRIDEYWNWHTTCKVDFRVYWHGDVEVWFDKLVVDDGIANELFKGDWDPEIEQQAEQFTNYNSYYTFFTDEICISQVPCIKYVMNLMRSVAPNQGIDTPKFSVAVTNYLHMRGLRNDNLSYKYFFDSLEVERVQMDVHKFSCLPNDGYIPDVFSEHDSFIPASWFKDPAVYNTWLQNTVFGDKTTSDIYGGSFIYQVNKIRQDSRQYSPSTLLIMQPQLHAYLHSASEDGDYSWGLREPTDQEIEAQAMLSIAHGADGLCWFVYHSGKWDAAASDYVHTGPGSPQADWLTLFGLRNRWNDPDPYSLRTENMYDQNKWNDVAAMNQKLLDLKPTLDNLYWLFGYSTHSEGTAHGCITDIESIFRNSTPPYEFNPGNLDQTKYWEMGFFEPLEPHFDEHIKYVMFVNRRCVPEQGNEGHGDVRQLKIKFNPASFLNYNNWTICDVLYPDDKLVFNKNSNDYIDLGNMSIFQPGEGRIFKLEPVFQTGGTLVTDELITSGASFTCEDTVWTNGYDLTIEDGVTINFSDSAKFIVHGGTFQLGNPQHSGPNTINIVGESGSWKGFEFDTCNVKIYGVNFAGLANDQNSAILDISSALNHKK